MKVYTMDSGQLQESANNAAQRLIEALHRDGLLKADPEEIAKRYVIVLAEPNWFGRLFAKLCGQDADKLQVYVATLK